MGKVAQPFDGLLGIKLARKPQSAARTQLVVNGQHVKSAVDLKPADQENGDQLEGVDVEKLKRDLKNGRHRTRYLQERQNPEAMAKRQAWYEENRDKVRAYKKAWDAANRDRNRELQRDWAKREYHSNPVKHRQKQRDYYERNREQILAKLKVKRDAAKAANAADADSKGD